MAQTFPETEPPITDLLETSNPVTHRFKTGTALLLVTAVTMMVSAFKSSEIFGYLSVAAGLGSVQFGSVELAALCFGIVYAIPIWAAMIMALLAFSFTARLGGAAAWLAVWCLAYWAGTAVVSNDGISLPVIVDRGMIAVFPSVTLVLSAIFFIARVWFGWQISANDSTGLRSPRQVSIFSLMIATALVALCLTPMLVAGPNRLFLGAVLCTGYAVLGLVLIPLVRWLMDSKYYLWIWLLGIPSFFGGLFFVIYASGGSYRSGLITSVSFGALFFFGLVPVVAARLYGMQLVRTAGRARSNSLDAK